MPSVHLPTKPFDVVAMGEAMVEFNQTRPHEPHYLQGFGGDTSNAVIAASRAGATTAYLSRLGHDAFGDALMDLWRTERVDTGAIGRDIHAHTGVYFVTHTPQGHAFSYLRAGSAASRMDAQWLASPTVQSRIAQAKVLHVSGISLAISHGARDTVLAAMRSAKSHATQVSLDSNLRLKLWSVEDARSCLTEAMGLCDVFLPSLEDIQTLTGMQNPEAIVQWSHDLGARQVVLKLGADGALVSDGLHRVHVPGRRVAAVDATGAGDCFCGNLLARITQGDSLVDATRYANAAASLAVQGFGAVAPLPTPAQVSAVLQCQ
ncbi:sugar kinase [Rhodoferax aquaticus]|uniref:Sugar kinase n=1 Tax=Rhodoferax aquaticus TaxID=2527691 RepID=A0A515EUB2_9BURK|nr:sugar kinase [Rhodoferax aquaticus]QDL56265.1 sugar kinase [Rhodoferax aquaticus]